MGKRWLALLLSVCMMCSMIPVAAADNDGAPSYEKISTSEIFEDTPLKMAAQANGVTYSTSPEGAAMIAALEGVSAPDAEQLAASEADVNGFLSDYGVQVTQAQFDALVDLRYDCTDSFSEIYRLSRLLVSGEYTEAELAQAFCVWSFSGGKTQQALVERRVRDAKLFLYGDYAGESEAAFYYVIFDSDGGVCPEKVRCYAQGESLGKLPQPQRQAMLFTGWYDGDVQVTAEAVVSENRTLCAGWRLAETPALRDGEEEPEPEPEPGPYEMRLSEDAIAFIKKYEGFARYAYWDYAQWSIGYGSVCGYNRDGSDVPEGWLEGTGEGITEEEADALLRSLLPTFETPTNKFAETHELTFKQHEFDALAIFSYGCGSAWTSGCRMTRWILNPTTELEFVDAVGAWCHAGGSVLAGLVMRRVKEAQIYLYGDYIGEDCPQYTAVWYRANGGTITESETPDEVIYYPLGAQYGKFPEVAYRGHTLDGWFNSVLTGDKFTEKSTADQYRILYAHWTESGMDFTDILTSAWYYKYVKQAFDLQLFNGITETTFGPDEPMTRGMLVTILYRLVGKPDVTDKNHPFADVADDRYFTKPVIWAYDNKIVDGITETTFEPETPITREQLATILFRYAQAEAVEEDHLSQFPDAAMVHSYAKKGMNWAVANGLITGNKSGGTVLLDPRSSATRAQVATILVRFIEAFEPEA